MALSLVLVVGCSSPTDGGGGGGGGTTGGDATVTLLAIPGVTPPVIGATPVTSIDSSQYTGTVDWAPTVSGTFSAETVYTATITLVAKTGFTMVGVAADSFTVDGASSFANSSGSGVVTAEFPPTSSIDVSISAIPGVTVPEWGVTPGVTIDTVEYAGTVAWLPDHTKFDAETDYSATITLTPKAGYTLDNVAEDFFTVDQALTDSNATGSGVVTVTFPTTGPVPSGAALWARAPVSGNEESVFSASVVASDGSVYVVGYQKATGAFSYGTGVSAAGVSNNENSLIVKYNSDGAAVWAKTLTQAQYYGKFNSVAVDSSGNVYVAGVQSGNGVYGYGNGVTVSGSCTNMDNAVLVKYDSNGNTQWAVSTLAGGAYSQFNSVSTDASGNIYVAGTQSGGYTFTYGTGIALTSSSSSSAMVLVKYNPSGVAQWARISDNATGSHARFHAVKTDSLGNVYAAGLQQGTGTVTFGTGVSTTGSATHNNVILVKYNSSGTAQWARTQQSASGFWADFKALAIDSNDNIYAVGAQSSNTTYTYGAGVTATSGVNNYWNAIIVKYDSSGTALWARTVLDGNESSQFDAVTVDSSGNVYAAGFQRSNGTFTYSTGISVTGLTGFGSGNMVLVKYDSMGTVSWAKTVQAGVNGTEIHSLSTDSEGNIIASGRINGTNVLTFSPIATTKGVFSSRHSGMVIKYNK